MTIDKAIRKLEDIMLVVPVMRPKPERDALKLGIEALKQVKRYRKLKVGFYAGLLPGEIEE